MSDSRKSILLRAYLVYVLVLIFGLLIIGKIMYLQWGQGDYWKSQAENLVYRYENIEAKRGNIYGADGSLLATSTKVFDIGMDISPKVVPDSIFFKDVDSLAIRLGRMFGRPSSEFQSKLVNARNNFLKDSVSYVLLKRDVSYAQLKKVRTFPIFRRGRFKGGLVVDAREVREMPYGSLARRTIGYVRLARYNVTINLGVASISKEDYMENADTLSLCLFNLFHDGYLKTTYRKLLDKSYAYKQPITRQIDSRQLERMKEFPLIAEMDSLHGFTIKQIEDEYKVGLEGSFDRLLRGRDGTRLIQKMGAGAWKVVSDENLVEPMNGLDIHTSIDVNLQDVAENALRKSLDSNSAEWGCCVLMEVKTGLIKAIANLQRDKDGVYYENLNNAVRQQIEPGSTFKLASVIAILEDGAHDTGTIVPTGTGKVGHRIVNDAYPAGYGYVSLSKAFEKSSNRGISTLTYEVFREKVAKFKEYIVKMGLANALGIELAGEPEPQMKIRLKDLETIPYGYVVKLTPLQILAFYNAVANNGTYVRPRFVESVGRAGETLYTTQTKVLEKAVCSQKTLAKVRKLLEGVVESGTATALKKAACKVAGKTGTARIYSDTGYVNKYVASFAGYFPAEKPEYSCIVVIYGTSGNEYSGSQVSAPVFMEVADKVYASRLDLPAEKRVVRESRPPLANVAYQRDLSVIYGLLNFKVVSADVNATWAVCSPKGNYVEVKPKTLSKERIPDVSGMSARDAVYLLESRGLLVTAKGVGDVVSQQPLAGSPYKMGDKVQLQLSMQEK